MYIFVDVRAVQRDLNWLVGKTDRTFFELNISIQVLKALGHLAENIQPSFLQFTTY